MAGRSRREGALIRKLRIILRVKEVFGERANIAVLFFWNSNVVVKCLFRLFWEKISLSCFRKF